MNKKQNNESKNIWKRWNFRKIVKDIHFRNDFVTINNIPDICSERIKKDIKYCILHIFWICSVNENIETNLSKYSLYMKKILNINIKKLDTKIPHFRVQNKFPFFNINDIFLKNSFINGSILTLFIISLSDFQIIYVTESKITTILKRFSQMFKIACLNTNIKLKYNGTLISPYSIDLNKKCDVIFENLNNRVILNKCFNNNIK